MVQGQKPKVSSVKSLKKGVVEEKQDLKAKEFAEKSEKAEVFKRKLRKCGVRYVPWGDRIDNDVILLPKLLNVCKNIKHLTRGYTLHSTLKRSHGTFVNGKHLYVKYRSSQKQIIKDLKRLLSKSSTYKASTKKHIKKHKKVDRTTSKRVVSKNVVHPRKTGELKTVTFGRPISVTVE